MRGQVAWFNNVKNFGFIERDVKDGPDGSADVFCHYTGIVGDGFRTLDQGDKVEFDTDTKDGRTIAVNVRVVEKGQHGTRSNSVQK